MQLTKRKCWCYKQQGIDGIPPISRKAFFPSYSTILCLRHQHTLQPQNSIPIYNEDKNYVCACTDWWGSSEQFLPSTFFSRKFICTVEQSFWWKPSNLFCLPRQTCQHFLGRKDPEIQRTYHLATATSQVLVTQWVLDTRFNHKDSLDLGHLWLCCSKPMTDQLLPSTVTGVALLPLFHKDTVKQNT